MNRCTVCEHKDSCVCIPYGCECFELDLKEHDRQLLEDLNEFLVEEKGEYVGSDINEFLAIRRGQKNE